MSELLKYNVTDIEAVDYIRQPDDTYHIKITTTYGTVIVIGDCEGNIYASDSDYNNGLDAYHTFDLYKEKNEEIE